MATNAIVAGSVLVRREVQPAAFEQEYFTLRRSSGLFSHSCICFDDQGVSLAYVRSITGVPRHGLPVYTDPTRSFQLLNIRRSNAGSFEVEDSFHRRRAGFVQRVEGNWLLKSAQGVTVGSMIGQSHVLGFLRRCLGQWLPQTYTLECNAEVLGSVTQEFRWGRYWLNADLRADQDHLLDRRLVLAALLLEIYEHAK
ncbi:MAG TPA: hypothetical protein VE783_00235 [Candidatus Limnocylindrales bacterium]|jgi:hypothetical protein|nr:hypothetical protein [Candidatus Limnocylindrales bacterium]